MVAFWNVLSSYGTLSWQRFKEPSDRGTFQGCLPVPAVMCLAGPPAPCPSHATHSTRGLWQTLRTEPRHSSHSTEDCCLPRCCSVRTASSSVRCPAGLSATGFPSPMKGSRSCCRRKSSSPSGTHHEAVRLLGGGWKCEHHQDLEPKGDMTAWFIRVTLGLGADCAALGQAQFCPPCGRQSYLSIQNNKLWVSRGWGLGLVGRVPAQHA